MPISSASIESSPSPSPNSGSSSPISSAEMSSRFSVSMMSRRMRFSSPSMPYFPRQPLGKVPIQPPRSNRWRRFTYIGFRFNQSVHRDREMHAARRNLVPFLPFHQGRRLAPDRHEPDRNPAPD